MDRIIVTVNCSEEINAAIVYFKDYICAEILADNIVYSETLLEAEKIDIEGVVCLIKLEKNG
jgi:hypothetical protein